VRFVGDRIDQPANALGVELVAFITEDPLQCRGVF
jgi:hypothetical protein